MLIPLVRVDERAIKINRRGRRKRIERAGQVRHRGGEDGGDDETGDAVRQTLDDEGREDGVVARKLCGEREEFVVSKEQHADQEKERELKEHDEAARDERLLTVALIATGQ